MKIPSTFECMGFTITVKMVDLTEGELCGKWKPDENTILINPHKNKDIQGETFWHEFMHCALETLGYDKLSGDEVFVDRMGQCLYQLMKTQR